MTRTPTTCYEIPILEVLYDLGGCGYRAGIIERVRLRLKDVLTDADYAERPGKSQEVYEHHADSMAQRLVERGLIGRQGWGVWELTPKGVDEVLRTRSEREQR